MQTAIVKRDKQCMTTEDCYDNHDLYLNYLRGGPGFGDPIDRDIKAIAKDLNEKFLLPEYAEKVYGAVVISQDAKGVWSVDAAKTKARRAEFRKERIARSVPTREWMKEERARIISKHAIALRFAHVRHQLRAVGQVQEQLQARSGTCRLTGNCRNPNWACRRYGSKYRMDLSLMPDVRTIVQVEE
jgi:acetone carboxylase alpha subunit